MKILNVLTLPDGYTGNWFCDLVGVTGIYPLNGEGGLYFQALGTLNSTIPVGDPTKSYSLSLNYTLTDVNVRAWDPIKVDDSVVLNVPRNSTGVFKGEIVIDNVAEEYRVYPVDSDPVTYPMTTKAGITIMFNFNNTGFRSLTTNMVFSELEEGETRAEYLVSEERTFTSLANDITFHSSEVGVSNLDELNRLVLDDATTLKASNLVATASGVMAIASGISTLPGDDLEAIIFQAPVTRNEELRESTFALQVNDLDQKTVTPVYSETNVMDTSLVSIVNKSDVAGGLTAETVAGMQVKFGGAA